MAFSLDAISNTENHFFFHRHSIDYFRSEQPRYKTYDDAKLLASDLADVFLLLCFVLTSGDTRRFWYSFFEPNVFLRRSNCPLRDLINRPGRAMS